MGVTKTPGLCDRYPCLHSEKRSRVRHAGITFHFCVRHLKRLLNVIESCLTQKWNVIPACLTWDLFRRVGDTEAETLWLRIFVTLVETLWLRAFVTSSLCDSVCRHSSATDGVCGRLLRLCDSMSLSTATSWEGLCRIKFSSYGRLCVEIFGSQIS